jgi:elongation factor G
MPNRFPLERIRNIAVIAHIDAGKTTVTERILYYTGRIYKIGNVDEGTTTMDFMQQERERGITISSAATTTSWKEHRINLIDTPGHIDFTAEVERSLRVLDGAVVVFDAVAGVQAQSEAVWRQADRYHVSRICFINKMDRMGADFNRAVSMIETRLHAVPLVLQLPLGSESSFNGVIDLVENKAWHFDENPDAELLEMEIPVTEIERLNKAKHELIEKIAELDDEVMVSYLDEAEITTEDIKNALRRITLANRGVPVFCGTALKNKGIQPLLDAVVNYLPSPVDMPPVKAINIKDGSQVERPAQDEASFTALAFKVVSDPFVGRLVYLRVYSGKIGAGDEVYNSTRRKRERLGRLLLMHANRREDIDGADTGSIVTSLGLKNTFTGDTLCAAGETVVLESIKFPEPVISVAIEPRTRADHDKIGEALNKLAEEDPTFKVNYNQETGQTVISGMGELHLDILVSRLLTDFNVSAIVGQPQVAYRETITKSVRAEGRFVQQSGGHGQYGHAVLELEPAPKGGGFEFVDKTKGGIIPKNFISAVEDGVREAMVNGGPAGYQVVDVKATLVDGSYHEVDSSELAFKMAGSMALKDGLRKGHSVILEPIMKIEIVAPGQFLGDIISDLNSRRGHIEVIETEIAGTCIIRAMVPLSETFGYTTCLRSLTQGRATNTLEFYQYREVPAEIAERIVAVGKKHA